MEQRLELSNNNFKVVIIKILQQVITNALETNENRKPSQSNRRQKEEPNGNLRTENM